MQPVDVMRLQFLITGLWNATQAQVVVSRRDKKSAEDALGARL
jgi:hypothetical protein